MLEITSLSGWSVTFSMKSELVHSLSSCEYKIYIQQTSEHGINWFAEKHNNWTGGKWSKRKKVNENHVCAGGGCVASVMSTNEKKTPPENKFVINKFLTSDKLLQKMVKKWKTIEQSVAREGQIATKQCIGGGILLNFHVHFVSFSAFPYPACIPSHPIELLHIWSIASLTLPEGETGKMHFMVVQLFFWSPQFVVLIHAFMLRKASVIRNWMWSADAYGNVHCECKSTKRERMKWKYWILSGS